MWGTITTTFLCYQMHHTTVSKTTCYKYKYYVSHAALRWLLRQRWEGGKGSGNTREVTYGHINTVFVSNSPIMWRAVVLWFGLEVGQKRVGGLVIIRSSVRCSASFWTSSRCWNPALLPGTLFLWFIWWSAAWWNHHLMTICRAGQWV